MCPHHLCESVFQTDSCLHSKPSLSAPSGWQLGPPSIPVFIPPSFIVAVCHEAFDLTVTRARPLLTSEVNIGGLITDPQPGSETADQADSQTVKIIAQLALSCHIVKYKHINGLIFAWISLSELSVRWSPQHPQLLIFTVMKQGLTQQGA